MSLRLPLFGYQGFNTPAELRVEEIFCSTETELCSMSSGVEGDGLLGSAHKSGTTRERVTNRQ